MKKLIAFIAVGIIVISGFGAVHSQEYKEQISIKFDNFPSMKLTKTDDIIEVHLNGVSSYLLSPGKPMLPMIDKKIELPFGVTDIKIGFTPGDIINKHIEGEIIPAPLALPLSYTGDIPAYKDEKIYNGNTPYPSDWYQYRIGCGLNENNEHVTFVSLHIFPVRYIPNMDDIKVLKNVDITITYTKPSSNIFPENSAYDLVIIAPSKFSNALQPLIDHKNNVGIRTILKTTEDIYQEYNGRDKPEQIKYFIKDALEQWGIKYVLLVGGLKSMVYGKPRDNCNAGIRDWYVPVRYTNLYDSPRYPLSGEDIHDPGVLSDLYYADIYREGGEFESWDHNNDGIFAAWGKPGVENDTGLDFYPDVALSRLACRSVDEVKVVVDKIINYESTSAESKPWFKKMIVVSGDGFLDQQDLNIKWDTSGLPDGEYTIYAQSMNPQGERGPIDTIHITLDKTKQTNITFNHDDHLNPALQNGYPAPPIAEIVSVSNGNTLGNTDYQYTPTEREAYCNGFNPWANISYIDGVLTIRGKSYDPKPYGNVTSIHVWVNNSNGETVFSDWRNDTEMYYEGEWTTGEKALYGRGGALYYMPDDFEKEIVWTSNGKLTGQSDVINAIDKGCGFLFFSGHGSPNVWADHYPGVPGNRQHGSVTGLQVITLKPWYPFISLPLLPINSLSNSEKLPIAVVGGCHNSQFNVSMILGIYDILPYFFPTLPKKSMWCHGVPVPETFSWRLISSSKGGAIASMGNTGLGYGMPGKVCTIGGGDSWITIEFFRQYGEEHHDILGVAYQQTLTTYVNSFDMNDLGAGHAKTVEQWVLLGDLQPRFLLRNSL